jgi:hypothetical protein
VYGVQVCENCRLRKLYTFHGLIGQFGDRSLHGLKLYILPDDLFLIYRHFLKCVSYIASSNGSIVNDELGKKIV